uniref:Chromosome segregation ATPase n=1 Tax=Pithovirus LCDPAC01 TaxID=2506600 RepID=A0A481YND8_9VIRU|nr:MAG: chromosome segregation ATPase [Pithovirus LCDPAC01]
MSFVTLQIYKFRSISQLELKIQEGKCILLSGSSGSGKSTILDSISFVLYGSKTNVYPKDGYRKVTWVKYTTNNYVIYRQKRSDLLRVTLRDGNVYEDAQAQGWIDKNFMTRSVWPISGYLKQGQLCGFLSLSSAKKLEMFQEMLFGNTEVVDKLHSKISKRIMAKTVELSRIETRKQTTIAIYKQLYSEIKEFRGKKKILTKDKLKEIHSSLPLIKKTIEELYRSIDKLTNMKGKTEAILSMRASLETKLNKLPFDTVNIPDLKSKCGKNNTLLKDLKRKIKIAEVNSRSAMLKEELNKLSKDAPSINYEQLAKYKKLKRQSLTKLIKLRDQCISTLESIISYRKWDDYVSEISKIQELKRTVNNSPSENPFDNLMILNTELSQAKINRQNLQCPECGVILKISGTNLVKTATIKTRPTEEIIADIRTIKTEIRAYELAVSASELLERTTVPQKIEKPKTRRCNYKEEIIRAKLTSFAKTIDDITAFNSLDVDIKKEEKFLNEQHRKLSLQRELARCPRVSNIKESAAQLRDQLMSLIEIKSQMDLSLNRALSNKNQKEHIISTLQELPKTSPIKEIERKLSEHRIDLKLNREMKDDVELSIRNHRAIVRATSMHGDIQQYAAEEKRTISKIAKLDKIKMAIVTAECMVIDGVLGYINQTLELVLKDIFTDPISITVKNFKELKTSKRIKPEINIEISYKGMTFTNLSHLSGGEKSRISVAIMIAFSKITNAKGLLIFDESISSISAPSKELVVTALRKNLPGRTIIMVNHDTTEGVYDDIIRI